MVTYSSRCPHCNYLLYRSSTSEQLKSFGNSKSKCPRCHQFYIDSSKYEWVNLTQEEKKSVLVFGHNMTLVEESYVRSMYNKLKNTKFSLVTIPLVKRLKYNLDALERFVFDPKMLQDDHIQQSIERTRDEEYLKTLISLGRNYYGEGYDET